MAEDVCEEYKSSLADLTFNSKPHINMLTILAEENLQYATDIVKIIEAQIAKATTTEKLPILYLMDSIIKNVGKDYLSLFTQNIVSTFVVTFEKVQYLRFFRFFHALYKFGLQHLLMSTHTYSL
uniref:pre-mRNA cleavage complex 2 protein Pcf11-like n=1 Tax=Myxine glutinosa TaxID=7769 RepID=UPI00358F5D9B